MDKNFINKFLEFEKNSRVNNIFYKNIHIWPIIRNSVYTELLIKKGVMQFPSNPIIKKKRRRNYFYLIYRLFINVIDLLRKFHKKKDILIFGYARKTMIEETEQNQLFWTIKSTVNNLNTLFIDSVGLNYKSNNMLNVTHLFIFFRFVNRLYLNKKWINYSKQINSELEKFFQEKIDFKKVYISGYIHQKLYKDLIRILLFINKPKIVIFSQDGSHSYLTQELNKKKIISIDFQHGMQSNCTPVFKYQKIISDQQKEFIPNYTFTFGEYWKNKYTYCENVIPVGNLFHESMIKKIEYIKKEDNSIMIISDGHLSRKKLIDLSIEISNKIKNIKIYYKLRIEEFINAKIDYEALYNYNNISVIANEDTSMYHYIKKSKYVIGINSTVLLESNKFSNITTTLGFFIYGLVPINIVSVVLFIFDPLINYQLFIVSLFASLIVLIGMYLVTYSFQNSKNHFSSIFALFYLQILWSLLIGIIFFNEYLNFFAVLGSLLIVLSGILSLQAQKKQLNVS